MVFDAVKRVVPEALALLSERHRLHGDYLRESPREATSEIEALTAVQIALLTIYDLCKAVDRGMTITGVRLLQKRGGKSGHYVAPGVSR